MSGRDRFLLYFLIAFLLIIGSYFLGYKNLVEATENSEREYAVLNRQYNELYGKHNNIDTYVIDAAKFERYYKSVLATYPAGNTQEYLIMFLKKVEDETGIWFSQTSLNEGTDVYTLGDYASSNPSDTSYKIGTGLTANRTIISLTYEATYDELKKFISYIENYKEVYTIDSISFSYKDEEQKISGTIQLSQYAVLGDREFTNVTIHTVPLGTKNIFSSSTFKGSYGSYEDTDGASIIYDYDLYMILSPYTSDVDSVIMGIRNDDQSILAHNSNRTEKISMTITGSEGSYRVNYAIGDLKYPSVSFELGDEFYPGNTLDMLVISGERIDATDRCTAKLTIVNESDMRFSIKIVGDDSYSPRFILESKEGDVVVY